MNAHQLAGEAWKEIFEGALWRQPDGIGISVIQSAIEKAYTNGYDLGYEAGYGVAPRDWKPLPRATATERCGAYSEHGCGDDALGCNLPKGHEGNHTYK